MPLDDHVAKTGKKYLSARVSGGARQDKEREGAGNGNCL